MGVRVVHGPGTRTSPGSSLLTRAEADDAVVGAAFTGSQAAGDSDRWSDTDLVLAVHGDPRRVASQWTRWIYDELEGAAPLGPADWTRRRPRVPAARLARARPDVLARGPVRPARPALADDLRAQARPLEDFPAPDRNTLAGDGLAPRPTCQDLHRAWTPMASRALDQRHT